MKLFNIFRKKYNIVIDDIMSLEDFVFSKVPLNESYIQIDTCSNDVIINKIIEGQRVSYPLKKGTNIIRNFNEGFYFNDYNKQSDITGFYLRNYDTSNIKTMKCMFLNCLNDIIDVSFFNTENVTNMCSMFEGCCHLYEIFLGNFNTSKVTDMSHMFYRCDDLSKVNLNSFDTTSVRDMSGMFYRCRNLTSLRLNNFKTDNLKYISDFLKDCNDLTNLYIENFDFSENEPTTYSDMFKNCYHLTYIKCKQSFKDWCMKHQDEIGLPINMWKNGKGVWDIVDKKTV